MPWSRRRCRSRPSCATAVEQAEPRPVSPVYPQITEAIYKNVYAAINGQTSPDQAVQDMNERDPEGTRHVLGRVDDGRQPTARLGRRPVPQTRATAVPSAASRRRCSRRRWSSSPSSPRTRSATRSGCRSTSTASAVPACRASSASTTTPTAFSSPEFWEAVWTTFVFTGDLGGARAGDRARHGARDARGLPRAGAAARRVLIPWAILTVVSAITWRTMFEPEPRASCNTLLERARPARRATSSGSARRATRWR